MLWRAVIIVILTGAVLFSGSGIPKVYLFRSSIKQELVELRAENEALRAEIAERQRSAKPLRVKIYSTFPFNNRHEISVAAGSQQGVKPGMPVAVAGEVLLGQVKEVFENRSVVRTLFDGDWKSAIRIGDGRLEALLVGGHEPRLSMLDKKFFVQEGDKIYAAGQGFPYGLFIGAVKDLSENQAGVWRDAAVNLPYNFNDLREAIILTDYVQK